MISYSNWLVATSGKCFANYWSQSISFSLRRWRLRPPSTSTLRCLT